jgi:hypothetical protein
MTDDHKIEIWDNEQQKFVLTECKDIPREDNVFTKIPLLSRFDSSLNFEFFKTNKISHCLNVYINESSAYCFGLILSGTIKPEDISSLEIGLGESFQEIIDILTNKDDLIDHKDICNDIVQTICLSSSDIIIPFLRGYLRHSKVNIDETKTIQEISFNKGFIDPDQIRMLLFKFQIICIDYGRKTISIPADFCSRFANIFNIIDCNIHVGNFKKQKQYNQSYYKARISNIEQVEDSESMCVTVPEGNMFIQNGICGGNCQGSQLNNVILYSPIPGFIDADTKRRWLYTSVTRAVKTLKIIV